MNALHEVRQVFDDRNMFLQVALGLISASLGLERVLREEASLAPSPEAIVDDPTLDFVLGLVAFAQRIVRHAETAAAAQEGGIPLTGAIPAVPAHLGRGLLT